MVYMYICYCDVHLLKYICSIAYNYKITIERHLSRINKQHPILKMLFLTTHIPNFISVLVFYTKIQDFSSELVIYMLSYLRCSIYVL